MNAAEIVLLTAAVTTWTLLNALAITAVIRAAARRDDTDTPSTINCPIHGADCEAWS